MSDDIDKAIRLLQEFRDVGDVVVLLMELRAAREEITTLRERCRALDAELHTCLRDFRCDPAARIRVSRKLFSDEG